MRLATIKKNEREILAAITPDGQYAADINALGDYGFRDMNDLIRDLDERRKKELESAFRQMDPSGLIRLESASFLPPIPRPLHDVLCLGLNYREHVEETGREIPPHAVYFSKRAARCSGHEGRVLSHETVDACLDYEVELAVVIGRECSYIEPEQAGRYIFGYTVFNDFSARALQKNHIQYTRGKGLDTFAAMGPWIVTADEIAYPPMLKLTSRVNGETRQNSNTSLYLHDIPSVISELSRGITLEPGDIIATGTPSGVGMGFDPPRYLRSGDVVECEIEGIGLLRSHIL